MVCWVRHALTEMASKKPEYHVPTDENDPVFESLANQQTARRLLNRLSDDDQQFLGILIDAQLEGNYRRPPFKAVAEKLGISTHKVQYRWKTPRKHRISQ